PLTQRERKFVSYRRENGEVGRLTLTGRIYARAIGRSEKHSSPSPSRATPAPTRRPSQATRRMLKTREAADYLGISTWTLRRLMNEGEIAYMKYRGGAANFDPRDLDAYIERKKVG